ncbi:hypothetical protein PI125_g15812 [Phytophthora idaei]|nr:hypothetical protein PI125_g15812 [Phytophthora idaei]
MNGLSKFYDLYLFLGIPRCERQLPGVASWQRKHGQCPGGNTEASTVEETEPRLIKRLRIYQGATNKVLG